MYTEIYPLCGSCEPEKFVSTFPYHLCTLLLSLALFLHEKIICKVSKINQILLKISCFSKFLVLFVETRAASPFTKHNLKFIVQTTETHYNEYFEILLVEIGSGAKANQRSKRNERV